ncbi:N-acetylmuramoyl-L-alanine amidase [Virgibacillus ihumii]|uniref:N-acetylmuramoyl-L-alanine amidase n=1 Tax=Virgibacillus ihumii TaxID=2686091 RepID=UPI00157D5744|nr:N-acetylmuramoyl-L-alanine amidase [Virgibacillus ihumii]
MLGKQLLTIIIGSIVTLFIFIPVTHADNGETYSVQTEVLEVKNAPAQGAEVIGHLVRGDQVTIFQEKYGWVQTYYNGKEAWVASQYLIPMIKDSKKQDSSAYSKSEQDKSTTIKEETKQFTPEQVLTTALSINAHGPLSGHHIVIDPGHGGKDPGAIGISHSKEKQLTLATAKTVADKLKDKGATITITRKNDTYLSLKKRVQISASHEADAFISIHYNAFQKSAVGGVSTYYKAGENSSDLAKSIQGSLMNTINLNNRGAKQADYFVLRENSNAAVLVELGFITNPNEIKAIKTDEYREKVARGIYSGLKEYFRAKD